MHTVSPILSQRAARRPVMLEQAGAVRLFEADPELASDLPADLRARLVRHVLADVVTLERGRWHPRRESFGEGRLFGLLVLEGALARRVTVGHRRAAELLGEGDLVRPQQKDSDEYALVEQASDWSVLAPTRFAVLDEELVAGVAGIAGVLPELAARAVARSRALVLRLAITQIPQLADRLHLLLWHLADRWGRREQDVVRLTLRLPQDLLGELVGAQRTSVNSALRQLADEGAIVERNGTWALSGDPPAELLDPRSGGPFSDT